jgi:two-component system phosphate regulon response regulator PhoB
MTVTSGAVKRPNWMRLDVLWNRIRGVHCHRNVNVESHVRNNARVAVRRELQPVIHYSTAAATNASLSSHCGATRIGPRSGWRTLLRAMSGDKAESIILVAVHEEGIAALIHSNLVNTGFQVVHAGDAIGVLAKSRELKPALIVLDMMLPGIPGKEVLRTLKSTSGTSGIPVIALSERSEEIDRIVALELGADDYVAKPFSARELALRVRAILSRRATQQPRPSHLVVGALHLDAENHTVTVNRNAADVSALDFRLLTVLMGAGGRVVSREELIEVAWGPESEISPRTVDTQLRRLREKLGEAAEQIQTVRGFGYRLAE